MEAKQLKLFKETDFERMKTFIKEYEGWYLFDNVRDRKDFSCKVVFNLFGNDTTEARVASSDRKATPIGIFQYMDLARAIRVNSNYVYNKRKGKLELKNGKG